MIMLSFNQVTSNYIKKELCKRGCSWIITFSHCLGFGYRKYGITTKIKCVKWKTFDTFLKRVNSILMSFQEELASLLIVGKPFSSDLEG